MQFQDYSKTYPDAKNHLVTREFVKKAIPKLAPDSHKGQNGRLLLIAGSPLFHGSGILATRAAMETEAVFGMRTNDWLYYCSTPENIAYMKHRYDTFLGITRDLAEEYLANADVAVVGPGLMREPQKNFTETKNEPHVTKHLTQLVLTSGKKAVLDAGSIQVISPEDVRNHPNVIITPHLGELVRLFRVESSAFQTGHDMTFPDIERVAKRLQKIASDYDITILLKGPVDIATNKHDWMFSPGGDPSLTHGGTGDVLSGVIGSLYHRIDNPLIVAVCGSYIVKRTGEFLSEKYQGIFDATDVATHVGKVNEALRDVAAASFRD